MRARLALAEEEYDTALHHLDQAESVARVPRYPGETSQVWTAYASSIRTLRAVTHQRQGAPHWALWESLQVWQSETPGRVAGMQTLHASVVQPATPWALGALLVVSLVLFIGGGTVAARTSADAAVDFVRQGMTAALDDVASQDEAEPHADDPPEDAEVTAEAESPEEGETSNVEEADEPPARRPEPMKPMLVLRRDLHSGLPEGVAPLRMEGDTMMPTYAPGRLLTGRPLDNDAPIRDGHAYVIDGPIGMRVKRLALVDDGQAVQMWTDNPAYVPITVPLDDFRERWILVALLNAKPVRGGV